MADAADSVTQQAASDINPKVTSADYDAQYAFWAMVDAILGGAETLRGATYMPTPAAQSIAGPTVPVNSLAQLTSQAGIAESPYLPRYENESGAEYLIIGAHAVGH